MKQISLDGRIGKDAQVLSTKGGKPFVRFSLANNSFSNGKDETEWFDITSYDPYVIENRVKYLTKGKYVIVHGSLKTEVSVKDNKVWCNQYVTASSIDTPNFGTKADGQTVAAATSAPSSSVDDGLSTYTGGTRPFTTQAASQPAVAVAGSAPAAAYANAGMDASDDLPF